MDVYPCVCSAYVGESELSMIFDFYIYNPFNSIRIGAITICPEKFDRWKSFDDLAIKYLKEQLKMFNIVQKDSDIYNKLVTSIKNLR